MKREYFDFLGTKITRHDAKIISLLVQGKEYHEICTALNIKSKTLTNELTLIFLKTRIPCARQLVPVAISRGFSQNGFYNNIKLFGLLAWALSFIGNLADGIDFLTDTIGVLS